MTAVGGAFRRHPVLFTLFVATLVVGALFAGRIALDATRWKDSYGHEPAIAAWMTPLYIVRTYDVPRDVMREILGEAPKDARRKTLSEIAVARGMAPHELVSELEAAILAWRSGAGDG